MVHHSNNDSWVKCYTNTKLKSIKYSQTNSKGSPVSISICDTLVTTSLVQLPLAIVAMTTWPSYPPIPVAHPASWRHGNSIRIQCLSGFLKLLHQVCFTDCSIIIITYPRLQEGSMILYMHTQYFKLTSCIHIQRYARTHTKTHTQTKHMQASYTYTGHVCMHTITMFNNKLLCYFKTNLILNEH